MFHETTKPSTEIRKPSHLSSSGLETSPHSSQQIKRKMKQFLLFALLVVLLSVAVDANGPGDFRAVRQRKRLQRRQNRREYRMRYLKSEKDNGSTKGPRSSTVPKSSKTPRSSKTPGGSPDREGESSAQMMGSNNALALILSGAVLIFYAL